MKYTLRTFALSLGLVLGIAWQTAAMDPDFARFVQAKQKQIRDFEKTGTNKAPSIVWSYFDALRVDDWETASNLSVRIDAIGRMLGTNTISPALQGPIWQPIGETIGVYYQFHDWDNGWLHRFGSNVISSIPKGSVYFGGTDYGRYVISALSESSSEGRPFFTLTQNQLVDERYLEYLRYIYGSKIHIPSTEDVQTAFEEYTADVQQRVKSGKLKPGEDVHTTPDGRAQVSGVVAVMSINGLLVKQIFLRNPAREFFIEESFALDWMYPYLEPHGLIMRLNREPLDRLANDVVQKDLDFWKRQTADALGDWLDEKTSVRDLCSFCDKVYLRKDLAGLKGNAAFVKNNVTQETFSKLRSSIAGVYAWRVEHDRNSDDQERMKKAADIAFRQSFALCPYSPEAIFRYTQFLTSLKRPDDALLIAETGARIDPDNSQLRDLVKELHRANSNE